MYSKQSFKNKKLVKNAKRWYKSFVGSEVREVFPPSGYSTVFEENFIELLDMDVWRYAEAWGCVHPDMLYQYYDGSFVKVSSNGLVLQLRNIPKTFHNTDVGEWERYKVPEVFEVPTGVGKLSSKIGWRYGWFEAWIQLPEGKWQWPAFWFVSLNSWPPEIDVFEAYSVVSSQYSDYTCLGFLNKKSWQKIEPNIHYGFIKDGTKESYGSYNVPVAQATRRFVQYVCHWESEFIRIYYDGILVFEVTDSKILKWFNDVMSVIFSAGRYDSEHIPEETEMYIKSFRVLQKQL